MKKVIRVLIILMLCIPFLVSATTYEDGVKKAKTFMSTDYRDTYQLYLLDGNKKDLPFGFDESSNKHIYDSSFASVYPSLPTLGGFISKKEFEISQEKPDSLVSSYMYDGRSFWTLTGNSGNHYVVGDNTLLPNTSNSPAVKVAEYVDPNTVVIGKGTKTNPWIFQPKYRVTVKGVNGTVTPETQIVNKSSGTATFTMTPSTGNKYSYNDCGLQETINGNQITFEAINRDINCSIIFGKGVYKLSFDQNDTTQPKTIYVRVGEKAYYEEEAKTVFNKLTTVPDRVGYTLGGYNYHINNTEKLLLLDENGNMKYNAIDKVTHDDTLETYWIANKYTVTLDANGGSVSVPSITVIYDKTYSELPDATRTGYDFLGWYTARDGGNKVEKTATVKITADLTLYARWKVQTYTLTYNANGGSVSPATATITYGATYPNPLPTPTKRGNTFDGWYDASSGGNKITSSTKVTRTSSHTIYAHWKVNSYKCNAGQYLAKDGVSCSDCPKGSYCPGGTWNYSATTDQGKTGCPGSYTSAAKATKEAECFLNVGDGKYLKTAKSSSTTNCKAGTHKAAHKVYYGKTSSCDTCAKGYISAAGKKDCTKCPSGQTSNSDHTKCYKPTVNCRKWIPKSCTTKWTGHGCPTSCAELSTGCEGCGSACCASDFVAGVAEFYYCSNLWDGCGKHNDLWQAYYEDCTPGYYDYKNNVTKCPTGYSEY